MEITLLLDNDLAGNGIFIEQGLKETGWDQVLQFHFKRLRDYGLPANLPDQEIWRFVQTQRLLLITNNRNEDSPHSLEATIRRDNSPDCLPIFTIGDLDKFRKNRDYAERVLERFYEYLLLIDGVRGTGRIFLP